MNDHTGEVWTVRRLLEWTSGFFARKAIDPPRLAAEQLLSHVLGVARIGLYTNYERVVGPPELSRFRELVKRAGEDAPIELLTGRAHFFNLELEVTRDVLIPRPDTETLVEHVLQLARIAPGLEAPRVLDLCTGSGCIAAAIAQQLVRATVVATDISEPAIAVARRNIERLNLSQRVTLLVGDLFEALALPTDRGPFDLIVSNPPYIPTGQIEGLDRSVRDYEPKLALDGGIDGLAMHRRILAGAGTKLLPGGRVFLEIAFDQGPAALEVAAAHGSEFDDARIFRDNGGRDRVLSLRRRAG